jgi:hypothetical protein
VPRLVVSMGCLVQERPVRAQLAARHGELGCVCLYLR